MEEVEDEALEEYPQGHPAHVYLKCMESRKSLHERNIERDSMRTNVLCSLHCQFCPCPFFPYIFFFLLANGTVSLHTEAY